MELENFAGQVAVVTGASRGIGNAIARGFAERGAGVILNATNKQTLDDAAHALATYGVPLEVVAGDISQRETSAEIMKMARDPKFGRLDHVVHAAGIPLRKLLLMAPDEDVNRVYGVKVRGMRYLIKEGTRILSRQKKTDPNVSASFIGISSVSVDGLQGESGYAGANAALEAELKSAALEFTGFLELPRVRANVIRCGAVDTDMMGSTPAEVVQGFVNMTAIKRLIMPHEVADLAMFLTSDRAAAITGTVYTIDGGMTRK